MEEYEIKPMVSKEVLIKYGISAVAYLAGGIFLLVLAFGSRFPILGIILSTTALIIGIGSLFSKNHEDKKPGLVITVAGVLGLVMRFGFATLKPFAGFALGLGGFGLLAAGIVKGIQFLKGLKSRQ